MHIKQASLLALVLPCLSAPAFASTTDLSVTVVCGSRSEGGGGIWMQQNPIVLSSQGTSSAIIFDGGPSSARRTLVSLNSRYKYTTPQAAPEHSQYSNTTSPNPPADEALQHDAIDDHTASSDAASATAGDTLPPLASEVYSLTLAQVWNTNAFDYSLEASRHGVKAAKKTLAKNLREFSGLWSVSLEITVHADGTKSFSYWDPETMERTDKLPDEMSVTLTRTTSHFFKKEERYATIYYCVPTIN